MRNCVSLEDQERFPALPLGALLNGGTLSECPTFPTGAKGRGPEVACFPAATMEAGAKRGLEEPERTDSESEVRGRQRAGRAGSVRDLRRQPTLSSPQEEPAAAAGRGDFAAGFAFSEKEAAAGPGGGAWAEALGQLKRKVGAGGRGAGAGSAAAPLSPLDPLPPQRCATSLDEKIATVRRQRRAQVRSRSQRRLVRGLPCGASLPRG